MLLEIVDVWKKYRNWILKGVSLSFKENGLVAIVGKNGSGKTTLLKITCGLIKPTKGEIKILGKDIRKNKNYKKDIGVMFHENILYEELTVKENLDFYAKMFGCMSDVAIDVFERLGLKKFMNERVGNLSYGWKKRLNFVRALINNPKIVLLDEPLSGLDESARVELSKILSELSNDKLVIFTSPSYPELECRVYTLENGILHESNVANT